MHLLLATIGLALASACSFTADVEVPSDTSQPDAAVAPAEPFSVWRRREPIYELYVRHFSAAGNLKGVEARLDELRALGIGIVWLMPVNEIGSLDYIDAPHGNPYAVKSYERLNPEYGNDQDLRDLVAAAHARGMHVILDWVPNHTAWDNPLITDHPDWYVRAGGKVQPVSAQFSWIAQLDWSKPALRTYMTNVMVDWVRRFDLDGFRIDFAHHMPIDFFVDLRAALEQIKPVFLLAEAGEADFHRAFDMVYDWKVYPVFGDVAHGARPVTAIDDALFHGHLLPYAEHPDALVMRMTYNHDDNGVFALGDRYRGGIKTFAVLASLLPGKPLIFDGQEVGGPSSPLGHDPRIKIDWSDPDGYRPFYTKLLQLFRANPALHQPGMADFRKLDTRPSDGPYAFVRRHGTDTVVVIVNLSANAYPSVTLEPAPNVGGIDGTYVELFSEETETLYAGKQLALGPWAYRVYVQGRRAL